MKPVIVGIVLGAPIAASVGAWIVSARQPPTVTVEQKTLTAALRQMGKMSAAFKL